MSISESQDCLADVGVPAGPGAIPLVEPHLGGREWEYVKECLDTNWVSSNGKFVDRFESMVAQYVGTACATATTSGTAALHVALLVAGVETDDEVLISTMTFIAPANAVRYIGAWPVFIDAEPEYWQMDPQLLTDFLETRCQWRQGGLYNKSTGRRVKAILPVHILGHPCDMQPIMDLAHKYQLTVIEDATESLGAKYNGRMVGALGDIACFSFNGNKLLTTGGGGMIVTDNEAWAARARYLTTQAKDDFGEYIHQEIGYNYRLTNLQAALGCAQVEQVRSHVDSKRTIAKAYQERLKSVPGLTTMPEAPWAQSVFWLYTVLVNSPQYGSDSRSLLGQLESQNIQARPLWQPGHQSPAHAGCQVYQNGVAERLYRDALSLPSSVGLELVQLERVADALGALSRRCVSPQSHYRRDTPPKGDVVKA